jgi:dihydrodipicolinate synthase/N-acetylneuraminate lyase
LVHDRSPQAHVRVTQLRETLDGMPLQAAVKHVLGARGVPVTPDVRRPLRPLHRSETDRLVP